MRRRWSLWLAGLLVIALALLMPLRIALGLSDFERIGFTARQVAGTIWYGRLGDLHLRSQPLGTFEVELDPAALLIGNVSMRFNRLEDPQGPLTGRLVAGSRRGIRDTSGRLAIGQLLAPLPVEALDLDQVTLLFRGGSCSDAGGRVTAIIASPVPGLELGGGVTGTVRCDRDRARLSMTSASGQERFAVLIGADGAYRAWLTLRDVPQLAGTALGLLGFRWSSQGLTLSVDGRL